MARRKMHPIWVDDTTYDYLRLLSVKEARSMGAVVKEAVTTRVLESLMIPPALRQQAYACNPDESAGLAEEMSATKGKE